MLTFFTILHVVLCVFMIFVILLQPGKDAGMGAALGGGAATSAFGGRGAVTFLSKVTAVSAALFFMTSLGLSFVGLRSSVAVEEDDGAISQPASPIEGGSSQESLEALPTAPEGAPTSEPVQAAPHSGGQPPALTPEGAPATPPGNQ